LSVPARIEPTELRPATENGLPWERLYGESRQAFQNFAHYRDLGPERSISKAALSLGKNITTLKVQSSKWHWVERCERYDDYIDEKRRGELESARTRVNEEYMALWRRVEVAAGQRLTGDSSDPRALVAALSPNDMEWPDVLRALEMSNKGLRLATGQPTDYVAGKFGISADDLLRIVNGIYEIAERLVEPARRGRLAVEVQSFLERGGR
jgi:hypothetical protein